MALFKVEDFKSTIIPPPIGPGNLFVGDHISRINGRAADPKITGYGVITWLKLPPWLQKTFEWYPEAFEKNVLSVSGLSDITLEKAEVAPGGFTNETLQIVTGIKKGNKEVTVGYKEFSMDPMSKVVEFWIHMMRDINTGICLYASTDFGGQRYRPSEENHTGVLLYATLKPDVINFDSEDINENSIMRAHMWTNVTPNAIKRDSDNFTAGTHDQVDAEQTFTGLYHCGPNIDRLAVRALKNHSLIRDIRDNYANIETENFLTD